MIPKGSVTALSLACLFSGVSAMASEHTSSPPAQAHWAFQNVVRPPLPTVRNRDWSRTSIDCFILSELEKHNLAPAAEADKAILLRRAYFDVIGLPPKPREVDAFLADKSPRAWEKVVDRLLGSPQYGERWARHWLDLARYAESEGFKEDGLRPNIWRYRDYVIRSFNSDKPYDRFLSEQIAGDELWPDDPEARIATGFNRHYPDEHNARVLRQRRQEILNDITDTTASVFLGLTYACARCHDHKFDPILQTDYYRLQAFFANVYAADNVPLLPKADLARYKERLKVWEEKTSAIRAEMSAIEAPKRKELENDLIEKYPDEVQSALRKSPEERNPFDWLMYHKARQYLDPDAYQYVGAASGVLAKLKGAEKSRWQELKDRLDGFASLHPGVLPATSGIADAGREAPKTHLLVRGVYDKPREELEPGLPEYLGDTSPGLSPPVSIESTGRRSALARALTNPQNPLTARVMVNRIWQYHFGGPLVGTPSDYGLKGEAPTHPALLDWLASEFIELGWSLKHIHRLILTSSAYRQSSQSSDMALKLDPDNKWLSRYPRHRLEAEAIRDAGLSVAGLINPNMQGPSIWPELPPGMASRGGWKTTTEESERNRRSIYVVAKRNTRYPMFESFDMPDSHETCPRRNVQALTMLNSDLTLKWARHFAASVVAMTGSDLGKQIDAAFRLALARSPDMNERTLAGKFFAEHGRILAAQSERGEPLVLPPNLPKNVDRLQAAVLVDFCHMLINANEFVYQN